MWMTASSVIALLGFADLGMGNGLLNSISESDGINDRKSAQIYVTSAFYMLLAIAILIMLFFALMYPFIPWAKVFNVVSDQAIQEAGPSMAVLIVLIAINMPLGVAQRVQLGYQEGYKTHLWGVLGSLLGFGGVLVAIYFKAGLIWLVLAMSGGPCFAMLLNWLDLFFRSRRWLFPRWSVFDVHITRKLAGTGMLFLALQVMAIIGSASDNIVIAQILGASAVSVYAVTQKLFVATMIAQYFIAPLWPAFGEALSRKDYVWAKKTLRSALKISFVMSAATAIPLIFLAKPIIHYWVGPELIPSIYLSLGFAAFVFLASYGGVMSTLLNNGEMIRPQVIFYSAASISSLVLKIVLTYKIGVAGTIWATIIGYSIFYIIPAGKLAHRYLDEKTNLS
ncbi:hypothetical protein GALL_383260 [mine drainage metagenome]|uniref:Polysaccharide biosynthesis protein n=1 Tax=mine drainage metagenome TaxID=410659 RepID=A0A1J5QJ05_9ZZZZ